MYKRMDKQKYIKLGLGAILFAGAISSLTYLLAPEKVIVKTVEVEKIIVREIIKREVEKDITKKKTTLPDGTVIEEEVDKSKEKSEESKEKSEEKVKAKEKIKIRKKYNFIISGAALHDLNSTDGFTYQLSIHRRVLGNVYVGIIGTSDKNVGVGISVKF